MNIYKSVYDPIWLYNMLEWQSIFFSGKWKKTKEKILTEKKPNKINTLWKKKTI